MRNKKNRRWKLLWILICSLYLPQFSRCHDERHFMASTEPGSLRNLFSPRMDYEQWKPIGHGDPLKNDPTYDYVPPVLDRVHYWVEPELRTPDPPMPVESQNPKTEILLLGVSSKKPATGTSAVADSRRDTFDPFTKYVGGSNQRISRPSFLPSNFFNFGPNKNTKYLDRGHIKGSEPRVPYTMLMPPPVVTRNPNQNNEILSVTPQIIVTQKPIEAGEVSIQNSNLVYHSSSPSDGHEFSTIPSESGWQTTSQVPYREQIVFNTDISPPESFIHIEFSPTQNFSSGLLEQAGSNQQTNYVTPPALLVNDKIMFKKGHVSDDESISNSYVKIGKPEAEVHSSGIGVSSVRDPPSLVMFPHAKPFSIPVLIPSTMKKVESIQSTAMPTVFVTNLSQNATKSITKTALTSTSSTSLSTTTRTPTTRPTTTSTTTSTTMSPMSTTSTAVISSTQQIFKQFKDTQEHPKKKPMYLIIQGHSKVKTYGPTKQMHGIPIQESNEIPSDETDGSNFDVKHLHGFNKKEKLEDQAQRKGRSNDLQTLKHVVQTGFGALDISDLEEIQRRNDGDFKESELQVGYEVGDEQNVTEKYYKGIVEEARKMRE